MIPQDHRPISLPFHSRRCHPHPLCSNAAPPGENFRRGSRRARTSAREFHESAGCSSRTRPPLYPPVHLSTHIPTRALFCPCPSSCAAGATVAIYTPRCSRQVLYRCGVPSLCVATHAHDWALASRLVHSRRVTIPRIIGPVSSLIGCSTRFLVAPPRYLCLRSDRPLT